MTSALSWLPVIACLTIIGWSIRRWGRRQVRYGPCMAFPEKASRRRRALARVREAWYRMPRASYCPPADGTPLDKAEMFALAELTLMWETGATRPDPVIPPPSRPGEHA